MKLSDFYPEMKDWTPVENSPTSQKSLPLPDKETQVSPFLRTTLPLPLQYSGDTVKQYNRPGLSSFRTMPLPPGGVPAINSASAGVTKVINNSSTEKIDLQTNGVDNADQEKLNLIAGDGVTLTPDPSGGVTVASSGGDGIVHGELPWWLDSGFIFYRDDFVNGNSSASGSIGDLGWSSFASSGVVSRNNWSFPNLGVYDLKTTSTGANAFAFIAPNQGGVDDGGLNASFPLLDYPGWEVEWVFSLRKPYTNDHFDSVPFNLAHSSFYVGLGNSIGTTVRPQSFIGVRYDTDTTSPSINDTTFHLEAVFNGVTASAVRFNNQGTNGGVFDTGIVPDKFTFYRLKITCTVAGSVTLTFSGGGTTVSKTFTVTAPTSLFNGSLQVVSGPEYVTFAGTPSSPSQTNGRCAVGAGSKFTVSGLGVGSGVFNKTYTCLLVFSTSVNFMGGPDTSNLGTFNTPGNYSMTGYPTLSPLAIAGNDSTGGVSGTSGARCLSVDYYSMVWNGMGLATPNTTPNSNLSRFQ